VSVSAGRVEIPYPHRRAGHCGSGAFRDLLEFHGLSWTDAPLSEGMAFGLGAGLGFAYVELPEIEPPIYLVGRTAGLERDTCAHLGIDLDLRQTDDEDEGWRWLREELEAGRPTMVWADIGELEYLNVRLRMTMHDIVVCGYDDAEDVAFIADNDRDDIQRCSLPALARARNSQAFPAPNRHGTWVMDFPSALPDARGTIETAVRGAVDNMRDGGRSLMDSGAPMGLGAVAAIEAAFPAWPERFGERLPSALRGLRTFVVKAGTGGALFRSLHAEFLRDAAALLEDDGLADAAAVYGELSPAWVAAAEASAGDDPAGAHAAAAAHVARACGLERDGVAAMEACV
jgi:Butirosin biosynthesis protein H, N-terminal/Domain of unknown function (DUF4872)